MQGAVIGGIVGGVIGGIDGGLRAQGNGKEFWSGKDTYKNIKIGNGQPVTFSGKTDFSDRKYDVDVELNLKSHQQSPWSNTCTYVEKVIADDFFCASGQDQINANWYNEVSGSKGLNLDQIKPHYENAGYLVNEYPGLMNSESALPWIANEMKQGRIVQFNLGYFSGHNVSVTRVRYMLNFKDNIVNLNNYNTMRGVSKAVKQIISIWRQ